MYLFILNIIVTRFCNTYTGLWRGRPTRPRHARREPRYRRGTTPVKSYEKNPKTSARVPLFLGYFSKLITFE